MANRDLYSMSTLMLKRMKLSHLQTTHVEFRQGVGDAPMMTITFWAIPAESRPRTLANRLRMRIRRLMRRLRR